MTEERALNLEEINILLADLQDWELDGSQLVKNFAFDDFNLALEFVNKVAEIAEQIGHHPDIFLHGWNKVRIMLSTHSVKGLTEKDFELARMVDEKCD